MNIQAFHGSGHPPANAEGTQPEGDPAIPLLRKRTQDDVLAAADRFPAFSPEELSLGTLKIATPTMESTEIGSPAKKHKVQIYICTLNNSTCLRVLGT